MLAACVLGAALACQGPGIGPIHEDSRYRGAPAWTRESLSWEKLAHLEHWLDSPEAQRGGYWRVEARLQLSEGRITFTRKDLAEGGADLPLLAQRLEQARHGFEQVLTDPERDLMQSNRAHEGLSASAELARSLEVRPTPAALVDDSHWIPRARWGATPPRTSRLTPHSGAWSRITIHHSAMSDPLPMRGPLSDSIAVVRRIQRAHTQARHFGDVGYHYLIDPFGRVFEGRARHWQGAHAGGSNNVGNIGICLLGNFEHERPTPAALQALEALIEGLREREGIPRSRVAGHRRFGNTDCPGRNLEHWLDRRYRS